VTGDNADHNRQAVFPNYLDAKGVLPQRNIKLKAPRTCGD